MSAPAPAAGPPVLPNISTITGPMLLGHLFNWMLFGVLSIQVYIYGVSFRRDKLGLRILVYFLFLLDILQTAFATHYAWYVLAGGWGNLIVLNVTTWTLATIPPLSGLIALLVQGFFCWRIWILAQGNKLYIPLLGVIGVASVGSCISAWYAGIVSGSLHNISEAALLDPEVTGWLASSMACDSMITITLVWQLSRRRNEGFASANHIVHRAMRMTVETGALTTAVSAIELALYLHSSLSTWYFMFGMTIGKLYSNSLLATLNSRSPMFQKSTLINTSTSIGVHAWDVRVDKSTRGEASTATSFPEISGRKDDIELGRVQQDSGEYESKPQEFPLGA